MLFRNILHVQLTYRCQFDKTFIFYISELNKKLCFDKKYM